MESKTISCLIDSSALLALIDQSDPSFNRANEVFEHIKLKNMQAILSDYVLQETFAMLLFKQKGDLLLPVLSLLQADPLFTLIDIDLQTLSKTIEFAQTKSFKPKLSFTNWTLVYLSTSLHLPVITFNKQLRDLCKISA